MFSPSSLEIARQRRRMTKKELAERAGITPEHLTRIGAGTHIPDESLVVSLAKVLKYPKNFMYREPVCDLLPENLSFRDSSASTAKIRNSVRSAATIVVGIDYWLKENFNLGNPDIPDLRDLRDTPEAAAAALRSHWGLGNRPIPNLTKLLESKGIRIFSLDEGDLVVDGASFFVNHQPFIMISHSKTPERTRFSMAHELAHLVLHLHGGESGTGSIDKEGNGKKVESEADNFASAFLMPNEDIADHLPYVRNVDYLISAKARWRVAVSALARRCFQLGILTDWRYRAFCKEISVRGFRRFEPESCERESSIFWQKVIRSFLSQKGGTDRILLETGLPADEWDTLVQQTTKFDRSDASPVGRPSGKPALRIV